MGVTATRSPTTPPGHTAELRNTWAAQPPSPVRISPGPLRFELTQTHSGQIQGQLTHVPVRRKEARDLLETRHQEILREQVEGGLQGWVWLQGVLQATVLHQRHVLALCGRRRQGLKARVFLIKELKPRNDNKCHEQIACFLRNDVRRAAHTCLHTGEPHAGGMRIPG